ncbi:hypothetical protein BASA81_004776 [Batrachochytrium salamandrivorans]|nr:hypothetical protein BASA81_004776 [Batrachochytrium salamandrivorans]
MSTTPTSSFKQRRFSTALPSVASLRSKFERPAVPVPAILSKASNSFRIPARKSITNAKPLVEKESEESAESPVADPIPIAEPLPRKKSIFQTIFGGRRASSVSRAEELKKANEEEGDDELAKVLEKPLEEVSSPPASFIKPTPVVIPTLPSPKAVQALPSPKAVHVLPSPKAVQALPSPKVVQVLPSPKAVHALPSPKAVQALPSPQTVTTTPEPASGILLCSDGYSFTLDAMRQLQLDLMPSNHTMFLDPTTCRSPGMLDFLQSCACMIAFVDSALISQTVQFQLERGFVLKKPLVLLHMEETDQELDQLFARLKIGQRDRDTKVIRFTSALYARERQEMFKEIQTAVGFTLHLSPAIVAPTSPSTALGYKYLITGYSPDVCDRIASELQALGYPSLASREPKLRTNALVVCLPSKFDSELDQQLMTQIQSHLNSGMPCVALRPRFPHPKLDLPAKLLLDHGGQVFTQILPFDATVDQILWACNVTTNSPQNTILRFMGDGLESYREVCCKARRFNQASNRYDSCKQDLFRLAYKAKLIALTAPPGWGKTTFLAELCSRNHPTLAVLSQRRFEIEDSITIGALHFFSRLDQKSTSAAGCIRSLSRQLLARIPGFTLDPITAKEAVEDKATTIGALLDALVIQPCLQLKKPPLHPTQRIVIVLDALEECEDFENLQIALNSKWTNSLPSWLLLVCSSTSKPTISIAQHVELMDSNAVGFLTHRLVEQWKIPHGQQVMDELMLKSQGNFLWLTVVEPLLVSWCENGSQLEKLNLPRDSLLTSAVGFVFDGFCELHGRDFIRIKQMYSLALCAPRSPLPIEIFSFCEDIIPPLLMVEDGKIKPIHGLVCDALFQVCQVSIGTMDHEYLSEALEQAYIQNVTKLYAAGHANYHARLAGKMELAKSWFICEFAKLFAALEQCVRETGDVLRLAQDCENLGLEEDLVDVIRLANQACGFDVREFVGQVIGRLPIAHQLANKAKVFGQEQFGLSGLALPNPLFSGLAKVGGPLKRVLRHRSPVLAAAESNGFILTCAGSIGFVWNTSSARVGFLKGHAEDITACTFACSKTTSIGGSTYSYMAFTGSVDKTAKFWQGSFPGIPGNQQNVMTCSKTFAGHHQLAITCVAFKGANQLANATIVTGSSDHTIVLWDFTTQLAKHVLTGHLGEIRSLQVCDSLLFSAALDKTCQVWDLNTRQVVGMLDGHTRGVSSVAVFQRERVYTGCFDGKLRCFDFTTRKLWFEVEAGGEQRINGLTVNSTGTLVAASSYDGKARVLDALSGELLLVLKGHSNDVCGVRFCSNNTQDQVVTCSLDCEVRVWAVTREKMDKQRNELRRNHRDLVTCVSINNRFAMSGSEDGASRVWNLDSGEMICELHSNHGDAVTACCVSGDGSMALTGDADGHLLLWDCASGTIKHDLSGAHVDVIETIQISSDNLFAKSVACDDTEEFVWDLKAKRTVSATANRVSVFPPLPTTSAQEENTHVLGPRGDSVGFTLDSSRFRVQKQLQGSSTQTFGQMLESFYLWECK